jgi:uncharacterized membrane protein YphA (DoxX/SURF4 family)
MRHSKAVGAVLWTLQGLLAALFLFAGGMKFVMPMEEMLAQSPIPLPPAFILFIGAAEVLGALGLVLPGLTRVRPGLTPLAALGLTIIMVGAVGYAAASGDVTTGIVPLVVGVLTGLVAYGRWQLVPHRGGAWRPVLQPAA